MKTKILPALLALIIGTNFMYAQGGRIDSTFGTNGFARVNPEGFYAGSAAHCNAIVVKKNGKIIMGGSGYNANNGIAYQAIVELKTDGTPDTKFGANNGIRNYQPITNPEFFSGIKSMVTQSDGKFIVAASNFIYGNSNIDSDEIVVTRFNANGTLDSSFGIAGSLYIIYHSQSDDQNPGIALQTDGRILVAGTSLLSTGHSSIIVWRFFGNGSPDYTFNSSGMIDLANYFPAWTMQSTQILLQGNNILIGGNAAPLGTFKTKFMVIRLQDNGIPDATFGIGGFVVKGFGSGSSSVCNDIVLQKNGAIVATGVYSPKNQPGYCTFINFTKNGKLNKNFNDSGILLLPQSLYATPNSVAIQSDGKIVAAGLQYTYGSHNHGIVIRINPNGHRDSSFATNGIITPDSTFVLYYSSVAIDTNDNIVVGGYGTLAGYGVFVAARYLSALSLNIASNEVAYNKTDASATSLAAPLIYPNPIQSNALLTYTLDKGETVSVLLYDINGRLVQTIISNNMMVAGVHRQPLHFDQSILPGNYILMIKTATKKTAIKIIKQ